MFTKSTFCNDHCLTNKRFRPSYGISEGSRTVVAFVPAKEIELLIEVVGNSPENVEKRQFFKDLDWFKQMNVSTKT